MDRELDLQLPDAQSSRFELGALRGRQSEIHALVDALLRPPDVHRLLAYPEVSRHVGDAPTGRDQVEQAPAKCALVDNPAFPCCGDSRMTIQLSDSTKPQADQRPWPILPNLGKVRLAKLAPQPAGSCEEISGWVWGWPAWEWRGSPAESGWRATDRVTPRFSAPRSPQRSCSRSAAGTRG
jgi:hypothetical protein